MIDRIKIIKIVAFSVVLSFLVSGFSAMTYGSTIHNNLMQSSGSYNGIDWKNSNLRGSVLTAIPYPLKISNSNLLGDYVGNITVMITFKMNNETSLLQLLKNLSTPNNPEFHRYISKAAFEDIFCPSWQLYNQSIEYFKSFGVGIQTYSDRMSLTMTGTTYIFSKMFNVSFYEYSNGKAMFYSINKNPLVPIWMAPYISQISGLDDYYKQFLNLGFHSVANKDNLKSQYSSSSIPTEYPIPINSSGTQYIYGSDLQVAYDEQTLFNYTYPTNQVVATILWSGQYIGPNTTTPYGYLTNGTLVGPFNPSDIYTYYNDTLPPYEPHSRVTAVPLAGAPGPGPLASYDTSGAVSENTLDIEMVGSTAPGVKIFNVYGPTSSNTYIDQAMAFILNPNSSFSELNSVSVISNSWGAPEYNDTAWYQYLQEAQARGITVLASSGDSGDNPNSSKYTPPNYTNDWVEFPSSMAYNYFGVTAVGGTTLTLNSSLNIESQVAWYISSSDTANGGPAGSTGGISEVFPEPIWQSDTIANKVINNQGRGVPDIAAIANNTIVYLTTSGTSQYLISWGTSVASPVEAGIVAEINAVLSLNNQTSLGYLNPLLYTLGNEQLSSLTYTNTIGYDLTGSYNSSLPTLPFYNVYQGRNHIYNATYRYNLVTGWGSIDAYNLTMYVLNKNYSGVYGALDGVENILNLTGLNVTSYFSNGTINTAYNASIQQNFFVANSLGAPVYWIQNVIYIKGSQKTGWIMNYTGWVIYPFYGLYPNATVYEHNFPAGKFVSLPHTFVIKTWISNETVPMNQMMNFQVNSQILQIPVPGATFIIGSYNYSYLWQGKVHTNGPYPSNANPGGLAPQFGLVGGPSASTGDFEAPTAGYVEPYILPMGSKNYISPITRTFTTFNDQTGEIANNLNWVNQRGNWYLSTLTGNNTQGVISVEPYGHPYNVTFIENGLLPGTSWSVTLNGSTESSTTNTITFTELNGTYSYTIGSIGGYTASPRSGTIDVNGANVNQAVTFAKVEYSVTFKESGLPLGTAWYINISNGQSYTATGTAITFSEPNGTYSYVVSSADKNYSPNLSSGSFAVNGSPISEYITFSEVTYAVTFMETGLLSGATWNVTLNGVKLSSPSSSILFNEPNGTYSYIIGIYNGYSATPYSGQVTVNGASPPTVSITFTQVKYSVTFTETGLPSGTSWSVTLSNVTRTSTNGTIIFSQPNGTYSYVITGIPGYRANAYSGTIYVNGNSVSNAVTWTLVTYPITIAESGISNGTAWSATITGTTFNGQYINVTLTSTTGTITFNEPNGTYSYAAHLPSGFTGNMKGSVTVSGQPVTSRVNAEPVSSYNNIELIAAIVVIIAVIGAVIGIIIHRTDRRRS